MSNITGITKYSNTIPLSEINDVEYNSFFACPRSIGLKSNNLSSMDVATVITCLSYSYGIIDSSVKTNLISIDLINEIVNKSKTKKNKEKLIDSLERLEEEGIITVSWVTDSLFSVESDVSNGFFKFYYHDMYKMIGLATPTIIQKAIHISAIEFSYIYGSRSSHNQNEKFVTYRSHHSLAEMCGMSRPSISKTLDMLEEMKIISSYAVRMKGNGTPQKSVRSRYRDRDMLRRYVEEGLESKYSKIVNNKEIRDNDKRGI